MDTLEASPVPSRAAAEPHRHLRTALWGALAYPLGAFFWACAAAGVSATAAPEPGLLGALEWFGWSLLWTVLLAVAAAPLGLPLALAQAFLWELALARFPAPERGRRGVLLGSALLALPWAFLVPWVLAEWLQGPVAAVIAFSCAFAGFTLPRLVIPALRPGTLLRPRSPVYGGPGEG